jgi:hypothetical protein
MRSWSPIDPPFLGTGMTGAWAVAAPVVDFGLAHVPGSHKRPLAHGTPFRRAVEEGLLVGTKVFQIGLRGTGYSADDLDWPRSQGFTVIPAMSRSLLNA